MKPSEFPVILEVPVAWGDMDAYQHVNNTRYFRFFESARVHYFEKAAGPMTHTVGPILAETSCKYIFPLTYPDTALVGARVESIGEDRFTFTHAIWSREHDRIAAIGSALIVAYDYKALAKAALPGQWLERIREMEADVGRTV